MTNKFRTLDDVDVKGKRVLLRVDLNVPMENGRVSDTTRLERVAPTITEISDKGGKVILLAHFGRPKGRDAKDSLKPVAAALGKVIKKPVAFTDDCIGEAAAKAVAAMKDGDILCLENTRFHKEEEKNDPAFVAELAKFGDLWVNDAFSAAHRAHASTEGLGHKLPAYAGRTMQAELDALTKALGAPTRPVIAIVGGAKVSTKIDLLENLVSKVDALVIGGGMANTFLHAQGVGIGKSLAEKNLAPFSPERHQLNVERLLALLRDYRERVEQSDFGRNPWSPETAPFWMWLRADRVSARWSRSRAAVAPVFESPTRVATPWRCHLTTGTMRAT